MPHPVRQMRLRKQRREQTEEHSSNQTAAKETATAASGQDQTPPAIAAVPSSGSAPLQGASVRLHKIMADHGLGSRRGLEDAIRDGKITVNGEVAQIGQTVQPGDKVYFEGRLVELSFGAPTFPRVLIYHKPTGEIVSRDDPEGRTDVFERLPAIDHGRWISIGRLDLNSEGLLLFTDSGELAHRLMHPRHDIEREYAVRVYGLLSGEQCRKLLQGVQLEDGPARIMSLRDQGGEGANHWYHVVLKEGRYREVRRIFAALELTVSRLIRVRYANLAMPSTLKRGDLEELNPDQVSRLMRVVGLTAANFAAECAADSDEPRGFRGNRNDRFDKPRGSYQNRGEPRGRQTSAQQQQQRAAGGAEHQRPFKRDGQEPREERREDGFKQHRKFPPRDRNEAGNRRFEPNNANENTRPNPRDENTDLNLKGGGGRHPFKRYSQRRVMSHQRDDEQQVVPQDAVVARRPEVRPEAVIRPQEPRPQQNRSSSDEDVDARLQQRYAEQERRGELRGLAGQTLGGQQRKEMDGNRRFSNPRNGGHQGGGGYGGGGYEGSPRPPRFPRPFSKPFNNGAQPRHLDDENYGNRVPDLNSSDGNKPRGGGYFKRRQEGGAQEPPRGGGQPYRTGTGYRGSGNENSFNRNRGGGDGQGHTGNGYPRPFNKKGFKKD